MAKAKKAKKKLPAGCTEIVFRRTKKKGKRGGKKLAKAVTVIRCDKNTLVGHNKKQCRNAKGGFVKCRGKRR